MTQKNIDQLLFVRDEYFHFLESARTLALKAILLEGKIGSTCDSKKLKNIEKLKQSARGNHQQWKNLSNKIDRISLHLYGCEWCVASTFRKELVEKRRILETEREIKKKILKNE